MLRTIFSSVAILLLAAAGPGMAQQAEFRASAHTVSVHATVVDREGQVVTDLTRDEFVVLDNGRPQALTVFDGGQRPISIVVMLDRSSSMNPHAARVEAAARAFVNTLLPDDRVRIGTFADEILIRPEEFASSPAALHAIIDRSPEPGGATPLWRATDMALDALETEEGQRVVLMFTDGRDTPAFSENVTFRQILARVRREETMVYAVGLAFRCEMANDLASPTIYAQFGPVRPRPGVPQFPRPPGVPYPGRGVPPRMPTFPTPRRPAATTSCRETGPDPDLRTLATAGGGGYFELRSSDDLISTFERVARELHSQYLLGFDAPELDGELHTLDVRVTRPGVTVRARRTYLAATDAP